MACFGVAISTELDKLLEIMLASCNIAPFPFLHATSLFVSYFFFFGVPSPQSKPEKLHGGGVPGAFAFDEKKHLGLKVHSQKPKNVQKKAKPEFKK